MYDLRTPGLKDLHPWLSHNCLRQAYLAFDMDTPSEMPQRPILQVVKIGSSTVTLGNQKRTTVKLQCSDGGMGQNVGLLFLQPDMLQAGRVKEPDFEVRIGYVVILLQFRVQQSPKTHLKYLRVSEMLIIDTMIYLRSETPIQLPPRVAQSQILNRQETPSENSHEYSALHPTSTGNVDASTTVPPPEYGCAQTESQGIQVPLETPEALRTRSQSKLLSPSPNVAQQSLYELSSSLTSSVRPSVTANFGYNASTSENLIPLASLTSKSHGDHIDCIAIIVDIFSITERMIGGVAKRKRDLHIVDLSQSRRTILSVWRDLDRFSPHRGDIILLKRAVVHRFDGRSLNAYELTEIQLNPEREGCMVLKEWWELKELEKVGVFDDFTAEDIE